MGKKFKLIGIVAILVALLPLWMWLSWLITVRKKMVIAIVDKTEITREGREHVSLNWVLNHERFTKTRVDPYNVSKDYFGFFPLQKESFQLKGLERFNDQQLSRLSDDCDAVYFTDTYGVYSNEWYRDQNKSERSGIIYGGMSQEDINLLSKMKDRHKLIITEYNSIGSPTQPEIRNQFEQLFALHWSGWIGRYFESLDTAVNQELPRWLISNYLRQHENHWPFTHPGIAFVSDQDEVLILEEKTHLKDPLPHILTGKEGQAAYQLPEKIKYAFWFDIMKTDSSRNKTVATFHIDVNDTGAGLLRQYGIPPVFPAVLQHKGPDYQFYYFCADFCDNRVNLASSYFDGISVFKSFFYNEAIAAERKSFFWNYYRPLLTGILTDHYRHPSKN